MTRTWHHSRIERIRIARAFVGLLVGAAMPACARAFVRPAPLPTLSAPVTTAGVVLVEYGPQKLTRIAGYDAKTGRLLWDKEFAGVTLSPGLIECGGVLYASTWRSGIYVMAARDGKVKRRLPEPQGTDAVACTVDRLYLECWDNKAMGPAIIGVDPKTFRHVWRRSFPGKYRWSIAAERDACEIVLYEGNPDEAWIRSAERVVLAASDGRVLRKVPVEPGALRDMITGSSDVGLSGAERERLSKVAGILRERDGSLLEHTDIAQFNNLLFVGGWHYDTRSGAVFAVQRATGRAAWKQPAKGIRGIAVADGRVFVTYGEPKRSYSDEPLTLAQQKAKALMALDARTGRVLWKVGLGAKRPVAR